RIRYRSAVYIKTRNMDPVAMEAPRNIFPRILHINAGIVTAFNPDATYSEVVVAFRDANHPRRRRLRPHSGWDFDHRLRNSLPYARVSGERSLGALGHVTQQILQHTSGRVLLGCQNRTEAQAFDGEAEG